MPAAEPAPMRDLQPIGHDWIVTKDRMLLSQNARPFLDCPSPVDDHIVRL